MEDYYEDEYVKSKRFFEIICAIGHNEATEVDYNEMNAWINNDPKRMQFYVEQVISFKNVDLEKGRQVLWQRIGLLELTLKN